MSSTPPPASEILELFRRLNADGTTLVVVTHDEHLAANAGRVVHMLDGRIVDGADAGGPFRRDRHARVPPSLVRKVRSLFLLLGFALGVGVMIVLLSVGEAMLDQSRDVSLVGGGELTVLPQGIDVEAMRTGGLGGMFFAIERARFLTRQILGGPRHAALVRAVAPVDRGEARSTSAPSRSPLPADRGPGRRRDPEPRGRSRRRARRARGTLV